LAETELVVRAREGDVDAFTVLVQRYQAMAFGYALANLGDTHLAEDAVQQAFITAYRSLKNLQQPERFAAWLRGIVRFESSHIRRSRRTGLVPIDLALDLPAPGPGPERVTEAREGLARILSAVAALPEDERLDLAIDAARIVGRTGIPGQLGRFANLCASSPGETGMTR
jgi:RNA polymerase sigma factor (sigma-70 family)